MFTKQIHAITEARQLPPDEAVKRLFDIMEGLIGNCAAALEHRGPVSIEVFEDDGRNEGPAESTVYDTKEEQPFAALTVQHHGSVGDCDNDEMRNGLAMFVRGVTEMHPNQPDPAGVETSFDHRNLVLYSSTGSICFKEGFFDTITANNFGGMFLAKGAVTAAVGNTPGTGTATVYKRDPTDVAIATDDDGNITKTVYSMSSRPISASVFYIILLDGFGDWWVGGVYC